MGSRTAGWMPRTLASLLLVAVAVALAACGDDDRPADAASVAPSRSDDAPRTTPRDEDAAAAPAAGKASAKRRPRGRLTVHVTRTVALRTRPGGPVVARIRPRTEFGSPTVLPVVARRHGWLGVLTTALPNGRVGWLAAGAALVPHRTRWSVVASLRRREVVVRRGGRVVQRFPVAIGGPSTPTPTGRFAVTDKLYTRNPSSPYGCCILALSARQPHVPQGWGGGDRIAIHATNLPETIGAAASLGCLRAPSEAIRRAVATIPLGTIVTIRA